MEKENYTGVLEDTRSQDLKDKDYKSDNPELASAIPVNWVKKTPDQWKNYPSRNQVNSSSCVAQAMAKGLITLYPEIASAHPIYRMRKNYAEKGMWLYDGADILKKVGTVTEKQDVSQNLDESKMNADLNDEVKDLLRFFPMKIGGYVYVSNPKDIDQVARAIEEHGHCIITVGSNYNEWSSIPEVQGNVNWYHGICAVDYTLYQGKKYIVIEDSWGSNIGQFDDRRLLSAEFLEARCTGGLYFLPYTPPTPVNDHVFAMVMSKGGTGLEVERLQKALKSLGFFPNIKTTQYYGDITVNAVKKFQLAYKDDILTPLGLIEPTGRFGEMTMKKLNSLLNKI
jgi:hypothetical protein